MTVRSKRHLLGRIQSTAGGSDEGIDKGTGATVVAQHGVSIEVADVQIAVGTEQEVFGSDQPAASGIDKGADESAPVVPSYWSICRA